MHKVVRTKMKRCKVGSFANLEMHRYTITLQLYIHLKMLSKRCYKNQGKRNSQKTRWIGVDPYITPDQRS
jgi:hypothetical protein